MGKKSGLEKSGTATTDCSSSLKGRMKIGYRDIDGIETTERGGNTEKNLYDESKPLLSHLEIKDVMTHAFFYKKKK